MPRRPQAAFEEKRLLLRLLQLAAVEQTTRRVLRKFFEQGSNSLAVEDRTHIEAQLIARARHSKPPLGLTAQAPTLGEGVAILRLFARNSHEEAYLRQVEVEALRALQLDAEAAELSSRLAMKENIHVKQSTEIKTQRVSRTEEQKGVTQHALDALLAQNNTLRQHVTDMRAQIVRVREISKAISVDLQKKVVLTESTLGATEVQLPNQQRAERTLQELQKDYGKRTAGIKNEISSIVAEAKTVENFRRFLRSKTNERNILSRLNGETNVAREQLSTKCKLNAEQRAKREAEAERHRETELLGRELCGELGIKAPEHLPKALVQLREKQLNSHHFAAELKKAEKECTGLMKKLRSICKNSSQEIVFDKRPPNAQPQLTAASLNTCQSDFLTLHTEENLKALESLTLRLAEKISGSKGELKELLCAFEDTSIAQLREFAADTAIKISEGLKVEEAGLEEAILGLFFSPKSATTEARPGSGEAGPESRGREFAGSSGRRRSVEFQKQANEILSSIPIISAASPL